MSKRKGPSVSAAVRVARAEVTELQCHGRENSYRAWSFSRFDHGYNAWVESRHTWFELARQWRRLAQARAAIDWACREFNLVVPYDVECATEQRIWANQPLRVVLAGELPRLMPYTEGARQALA